MAHPTLNEILTNSQSASFQRLNAGLLAAAGVPIDPHHPPKNAVMERSLKGRIQKKVSIKKAAPAQFFVRLTNYTRRLYDEDNICAKIYIDCCRYSGLVPGDSPAEVHCYVRQIQVSTPAEERCELTVERLTA